MLSVSQYRTQKHIPNELLWYIKQNFPDCKGQFRKLLRPKEQIIKTSINLITSKLNGIIEDSLKLKTSDTLGKTCYRRIKKIHFYKWGLFQALQSSMFLFFFGCSGCLSWCVQASYCRARAQQLWPVGFSCCHVWAQLPCSMWDLRSLTRHRA